MKRHVFHTIALSAAGIVWLMSVQTARAEALKMTLPQLVEYSLHHNGELTSFREEKHIRDAAKLKAGLLRNPTLDFEAGTGALTGSSGDNSLSVGISQEFLLAGKREKRLAVAEYESEMFRWQLADRERLLREEVKTAYYDVILAQQRIALSDRFIVLNRQLLDVTIERLAAGDIPELEMNLTRVELARSEGARIDVEKALIRNQAKLCTVMGLSFGEYPAIDGQFEPGITMKKSLDDLKQLSHEKRPDLKALEAEKKRGEADITLARAEGVSNITAGLVFKRDATTSSEGGVESRDTAYSIGIKLSLPIPLFDNNQSGVHEAGARQSSTESRLTAASRNVEREVATAYAGFLNTGKVLSLYQSNIIPQLEENLKLTQEAYRLGEVGILSVIQEQKKFFEVNDGYLTALHDHQTALVALETAVASELSGGVQ